MPDNFWGKLLAQLREEQGVSQRQLSRAAQISRMALRRIESGRCVGGGDIDIIETALDYLGHDLEAIARDNKVEHERRIMSDMTDPDRRSHAAAHRLLTVWELGGNGASV